MMWKPRQTNKQKRQAWHSAACTPVTYLSRKEIAARDKKAQVMRNVPAAETRMTSTFIDVGDLNTRPLLAITYHTKHYLLTGLFHCVVKKVWRNPYWQERCSLHSLHEVYIQSSLSFFSTVRDTTGKFFIELSKWKGKREKMNQNELMKEYMEIMLRGEQMNDRIRNAFRGLSKWTFS